jgi:hypothetical protein
MKYLGLFGCGVFFFWLVMPLVVSWCDDLDAWFFRGVDRLLNRIWP